MGIFGVGSHLYSQARPKAKQEDETVTERGARKIPNSLDVKPPEDSEAPMGRRRPPRPPPQEIVEEKAAPKESPRTEGTLASAISRVMEKAFLDTILKTLESNQAEEAKGFKEVTESGKASWSHTNFIFAIDCSGSMRGVRWNLSLIHISEPTRPY
eukprot:TRINITY_DN4310_c0_g1_i3.p4 TRINITY_DN4310_c0_g1~~TRINITY_DN4310_c0_g1_i3.p4  ORF type:complete len:156 (-),score=51.05 TRINITY_DN4310_c0_g1_i3:48-515(-)